MRRSTESGTLEVEGFEGVDVFKALASETRLSILRSLADGPKNVQQICADCGLSQAMASKSVQQLEAAGLLVSEYLPGLQGMQKRCRLSARRLIASFEAFQGPRVLTEEVSMPIGLYTLAHARGSCGLVSRERVIGFLDVPASFFDPARAGAQLLWMADGFVEYVFPCALPASAAVERLDLTMEICSEAPDYDNDWPSDITLWLDGVEIGTWTSPGDFGGRRGVLNPDWWFDHKTQFGAQKIWSVDANGAYVDGTRVSDATLADVVRGPLDSLTVRIGIKPDAAHAGGFNLFGAGFGNYAQDLVLKYSYTAPHVGAPPFPEAIQKDPL